jgi:hypothetical protein
MCRNARSPGGELRAKIDAATTTGALVVIAFIAMVHCYRTFEFRMGARLFESALRMGSHPRTPARYYIFQLLNSCAVVVPS